QNILTVWAGPLSGPAAKPTFKLLTDILTAAGVGSGSVTSVAFSTSLSALFSGSVSGSPITTNGTILLTLGLANQLANTVLAGPASGGSGAVSARKLVAADIFGIVAVAFSATPTFDASAFASPLFSMTLTGN